MDRSSPQEGPDARLTVADLLGQSDLGLTLLAGAAGLGRKILIPRPQKPGLILAGHLDLLNPEKVQILGQTELAYLERMADGELRAKIESLLCTGMICLVVTKRISPPAHLLELAERKGIPVLTTAEKTSQFIVRLTAFLEKRLAPQTTVHGVLMTIEGVGVLILGKSGIGKSECALDLVTKGHRLVADDVIHLQRLGQDVIIGHGPEIIKHHMEIRGLGIINIKDLFGVVSVAESARVALVVELIDWQAEREDDRLGLDEQTFSLLNVEIPVVRIPVSPGRSLSVILEVAARNHLLKKSGYHAAREMDANLTRRLSGGSPGGSSSGEDQ